MLNSCNSLLVRSAEHRKIITAGDSILLPAWEQYTEECFSDRSSLSFIFDISTIAETACDLSGMFWRNISTFELGFEINRIISNFYLSHKDRFCEKNFSAMLGLLGLEAELSTETSMNPLNTISERYSVIVSFIRNNIKNPELSLSYLAEYMGITERMIQYILAEKNVTFCHILSTERCRHLASRVKNNLYCNVNISIYESGFKSITTANRQFRSIYGMTPRQYQRQMLRTVTAHD